MKIRRVGAELFHADRLLLKRLKTDEEILRSTVFLENLLVTSWSKCLH